jgi:hypothetical protein
LRKVLEFVMWNDFQSFLTCIFYIFPFFTPGKQPYFEISDMTTHTPMNHARDIWWTLYFASAFHQDSTHLRDVTINASARLLSPTAIIQKYLGSNGFKTFSFWWNRKMISLEHQTKWVLSTETENHTFFVSGAL